MTDKAIRKSQARIFKDAGYLVPDNFFNVGVFYVHKDGLYATGTYGSTNIQIRCNGTTCKNKVDAFVALLEQAINS